MFWRGRRRLRWLDLLGFKKESVTSWRRTGLSSIFLVGLALTNILYIDSDGSQRQQSYFTETKGASRHLLSTNETEHGVAWEDCTFENEHVPGAWVFFHSVCILIIFIALAIVCDDFFVPSLEAISEKLNLSEDVAGATFMAAGSSAPELFTSVAGVAVETDVGIGTIVGSAVFNILIIIALTAALAGQVLLLDWRPMARDSFFYAMSVGCFIGFSWDGYVTHYEAIILLVLYGLYIVIMYFNPRLMDWMGTWKCCCKTTVLPVDAENGSVPAETPELPTQETQITTSNPQLKSNSVTAANGGRKFSSLGPGGHARRLSLISQKSNELDKHIFHHHQRGSIVAALNTLPKKSLTPAEEAIKEESSENNNEDETPEQQQQQENEEEEEASDTMQLCPCIPCCPPVMTRPPSSEEARKKGGCVAWLKLILRWILWIPAFPFVCLFSWTIPDCSKDHNRKWFLLSFIMSVVWIAILSFAMVVLVTRTGCILNVDQYTMGLVIIAIGTSVPDALSSILVARDGYGDMAVSNAIGSNVFDINLGLGLPFLIRICIDAGAPIDLLDTQEWVDYHNGVMPLIPHAKFGFILLLILVMTLCVFGATKFRLNKAIGISFVFLYVVFLAYAFTQELYCKQELKEYC